MKFRLAEKYTQTEKADGTVVVYEDNKIVFDLDNDKYYVSSTYTLDKNLVNYLKDNNILYEYSFTKFDNNDSPRRYDVLTNDPKKLLKQIKLLHGVDINEVQ